MSEHHLMVVLDSRDGAFQVPLEETDDYPRSVGRELRGRERIRSAASV